MATSDFPAILNVSDFNDSFKSVANDNSLVSIPMTGLDGSSELSSHPDAGTHWKKKIGFFHPIVTPRGLHFSNYLPLLQS